MTYALTETAAVLGFECLERDGYHLNGLDFIVEILNPDADGYGEVVVTTVNRKIMPLIRYRTRDVARLLSDPCPCGLPLRRLSPLRGRTDEIVASVWGNVHPDFFERVLGPVPGITDDWQVALDERQGKQVFRVRLELVDDGADQSEISERILERVEAEHRLAWQAYTQNLADVEFAFHPKGTLRKGRKLLRLVDERRTGEVTSPESRR
jgi:phenylacetate-CoA ligase